MRKKASLLLSILTYVHRALVGKTCPVRFSRKRWLLTYGDEKLLCCLQRRHLQYSREPSQTQREIILRIEARDRVSDNLQGDQGILIVKSSIVDSSNNLLQRVNINLEK